MCKKLILFVAAILVIAAASFAIRPHGSTKLSDLQKANIEALSQFESWGGYGASCYIQYNKNKDSRCYICGKCKFVNGVGIVIGGRCS